jgi:aspartokinase
VKCSLCLFVFDPADQQEAVTVVAGYAACARHARIAALAAGGRDWPSMLVIAGLSAGEVPIARPRTGR